MSMKKRIIISCMVIISTLIVGLGLGDSIAVSRMSQVTNTAVTTNTNVTDTTPVVETTPEVAKTWQTVQTFTGSSIKTTEDFTIDSDEWKVVWSTTPGQYGDMNFIVGVDDITGSMVSSVANVIGAGNDESYVKEGAGTYCLDINTAQNYTITVQELK